jgi:L-amino acid N-acyltransferase YncA
MRSVSIRPATAADLAAITRIYAVAVREGTASFEIEPPDAAEMGRRLAALDAGGYPCLVATRDSVVLGYAYAGAFRPRAAYRHTVEDSIYVAAEAQRQGIGRALLTALIGAAAARGFRQMVAVIGDSRRQAASIALHAALGFRHVGTLDAVGYKHGRWLDSVYMQRALGTGADEPPTPLSAAPR